MNLFEFDEAFGVEKVCGVDEAGRGPLAGPVVAAAVVLKPDAEKLIPDVMDSKKISEKKRERMYSKVVEACLSYATVFIEPNEIDKLNILNATMLAMKRAVEKIDVKVNLVLIDGNSMPKIERPVKLIVKGDSKSASIAAASIIAKVERDCRMRELHNEFPEYGFNQHKGYGTNLHYENLKKFGVSSVHRRSFLKKFEAQKKETIQAVEGSLGEKIAYGWLKKNGFNVIAKNFHSRFGEIDLIAFKDDFIFFVEVKLRKLNCGHSPKEAVGIVKQQKIIKTAVIYLQKHEIEKQPKFAVIEVVRVNASNYRVGFVDCAFEVSNEFELF